MKRISVSIWPAIRFNPFCVKKSPLRARLLTRRLHAHIIIIIIIIYTVMYTVSAENTASSSTRRSRLFFFCFHCVGFILDLRRGPGTATTDDFIHIRIYFIYITQYYVIYPMLMYCTRYTIHMPKMPKRDISLSLSASILTQTWFNVVGGIGLKHFFTQNLLGWMNYHIRVAKPCSAHTHAVVGACSVKWIPIYI